MLISLKTPYTPSEGRCFPMGAHARDGYAAPAA
jgi:membrane-associated PAP2 superfamily phosphatase